MTDPADAADAAVALRAALGGPVSPLAGGYSGETFRAVLDGDDVVVRVYGRHPARAVVDAALLHRLRGVVPVAAVLDAVPFGRPPYLITQWLPGQRLDLVLDEVAPHVGRELGRAVGGVLLRLTTVRFARPGALAGAELVPGPHDDGSDGRADEGGPDASLEAWAQAHLTRGQLAGWAAEDQAALLATARAVGPLIDAVASDRTLVHGDLNPKNLLVDRDNLTVTGVLDWEFAHSGHPFTDLGNLLRFDRRPPYADAVLAVWCERRGGTPQDALDLARAADLWALVDLAARAGDNPVADRAAALLGEIARTNDLHALPER